MIIYQTTNYRINKKWQKYIITNGIPPQVSNLPILCHKNICKTYTIMYILFLKEEDMVRTKLLNTICNPHPKDSLYYYI